MSHSSSGDVRTDLVSLPFLAPRWERIQVTFETAPLIEPVDPGSFRLRRDGAGGPDVRATRGTVADGRLRLRFNVMQGPGQVPLEPGVWRLVAVSPDGAHRPVGPHDPAVVDPVRDRRRFVYPGAAYVVAPSVDPADGAIVLRTAHAALTGAPEEAWAAPRRDPAYRIGHAVMRGRQYLFAGLYAAMRGIARRNGRRILFTSDSRAEIGGNLKIVWDRMVARGLDRGYEMATMFKPGVAARRSIRDRIRMPWVMARADVIVLDDYQPIIYGIHDDDVRIVQLWHAWGAFKTVGYSRIGKEGGPSPYARAHKNYDVAIVSSESEVAAYAEAFGIPESRVAPTGIPRMDRFFDPEARAAGRATALEAFPAAEDRFVILFAPTFRGNGQKSATYPIDQLDYAALHALCVERDAVCLIRMHPFVTEPLGIPAAFADRILDGSSTEVDVNDLLFAVDLLVTDYSSIVFEFSTLDRPMLFYAFDLEAYIGTRDFYVDYETFVPGPIVRTFAELIEAIRHEDYGLERLAAFRSAHLGAFDGHATDRVIDRILPR